MAAARACDLSKSSTSWSTQPRPICKRATQAVRLRHLVSFTVTNLISFQVIDLVACDSDFVLSLVEYDSDFVSSRVVVFDGAPQDAP